MNGRWGGRKGDLVRPEFDRAEAADRSIAIVTRRLPDKKLMKACASMGRWAAKLRANSPGRLAKKNKKLEDAVALIKSLEG
jgi:hypothetical protein